MFCIIVYAGKATVFTRELGDIRTIGNAFALFITFIFILRNKVKFTWNFFIPLIVFFVYALLTSVNNHMVNPFWISQWVIWLAIAYTMSKGFGKQMFVIIETVLCHLSVIALLFWVLYLITPSTVETIVRIFEFSRSYTEEGNVLANMVVFTLPNMEYSVQDFQLLARNPGFAWEPGAFACMICLGIFCNSLRTNFRLKGNRELWVFILALISTQSTTGLMIFIIMLLLWLLLNKKFKATLAAIPFLLLLFSMPFVRDKMASEIDSLNAMDYTKVNSGSFGRFYSFQLDYQEFLRHPILGLGGYSEGTLYKQMGYEFATISGIGHLLAYYGAIMTLLFFYLLFRSCHLIKLLTGTNNAYLLIVTVIGMMISYSIWTHPLYIAFWMFGVFNAKWSTT
jgi:hypothetical protein